MRVRPSPGVADGPVGRASPSTGMRSSASRRHVRARDPGVLAGLEVEPHRRERVRRACPEDGADRIRRRGVVHAAQPTSSTSSPHSSRASRRRPARTTRAGRGTRPAGPTGRGPARRRGAGGGHDRRIGPLEKDGRGGPRIRVPAPAASIADDRLLVLGHAVRAGGDPEAHGRQATRAAERTGSGDADEPPMLAPMPEKRSEKSGARE
jgi:hypothetical protein